MHKNSHQEERPDGDQEVGSSLTEDMMGEFQLPECTQCGHSILKPKVVFYGGSLDPLVRDQSTQWVQQCDLLVVCGSSLQVFSAYRLCLLAQQAGTPIVVLNSGPTRLDHPSNSGSSVRLRSHDLCSHTLDAAIPDPFRRSHNAV